MNKKKSDSINLLMKSLYGKEPGQVKDMRLDDSKNAHFEIFTFLETELKRVKKIEYFFSKRVNMIEDNPQNIKLIEDQEDQQEKILNLVINQTRSLDSIYQKKVSRLWNSFFNSAKL